MLMTVDQIKESLGITDSSQDDFIEAQAEIISDAIENYCGRKFASATWLETFYQEDYQAGSDKMYLYHYPVTAVTSIVVKDGLLTTDIEDDVRVHKDSGRMRNKDGFFRYGDIVEVEYTAGFAAIPNPIKSVLTSLVEERYNKKVAGVSVNFGSDVQSISIPGTISVAFDYSLQANQRNVAFGTILGNYVNVLDHYRSERVIVGSGTVKYVEVSV